MRDYLTVCDLGWVREQRGFTLRHELSSPPVRLLLSLLVLKDAGRNHYAVPGVDKVESHEPWHFADHGQELLLHVPRHLARVGHTLVAPYRSVHSFCTTSFPALSFCTESASWTLPSYTHYPSTVTGIESPVYSANALFLSKR